MKRIRRCRGGLGAVEPAPRVATRGAQIGRCVMLAAGLFLLGGAHDARGAGLSQAGGLRVLAQEGGAVRDVASDGRYVYAGVGPRLVVLQADERALAVVGRTEPLPGVVEKLVLGQGWAVVGLSDGALHVVDLEEPERPREAAVLPKDLGWLAPRLTRGGGSLRLAVVARGQALVVAGEHRLRIFDLRAPERPVEGAPVDLGPDREVQGLAVEGDHLYVGRYGMGYRVSPFVIDRFDASRVGSLGAGEQVGGSAENAALLAAHSDRFVLCASGRILLKDGEKEETVGEPVVGCASASRNVVAVGSTVLGFHGRLWRHAWDGSAPRFLEGADGMVVLAAVQHGDQLVVAEAGRRIGRGRILEGAWRTQPGYEPLVGDVVDVHVEGSCLVLADEAGIRTLNVASPEAPRVVGILPMGAPPFEMALEQGKGLIGQRNGEVRPVAADCTGAPRILGDKSPSDRDAVGVAVDGGRTFALEMWTTHTIGAGRLTALDFSDLAAPRLTEIYSYAAAHGQQPIVLDVAARDDHVAVVINDFVGRALRLSIVEPGAIERHRQSGRLELPMSGVAAVVMDGPWVYVAADEVLYVVRVSEAGVPSEAARLPMRRSAPFPGGLPLYPERSGGHVGMAMDRGILWHARGQGGVELIDVRSPALPMSVGAIETSGSARRVSAEGGVAYVADREAGLLVLRHVPPRPRVRIALPWAGAGR